MQLFFNDSFTSESGQKGLPWWLKNLPANAGDVGLILEWGRSPGEGNDNPLQYSCLGNPMDRGAGWATFHGIAKSQTRLSTTTAFQVPMQYCSLKT